MSLLHAGNYITADDVTTENATLVGVTGSQQYIDSDTGNEMCVEPGTKRRKLSKHRFHSATRTRRRQKRKRFSRFERESPLMSDSGSSSVSEYEPMSVRGSSSLSDRSDRQMFDSSMSDSQWSDSSMSESQMPDTPMPDSQMSDSTMSESQMSNSLMTASMSGSSLYEHAVVSISTHSVSFAPDTTNNASYGMPDSVSSSDSGDSDSGADSDSESEDSDDEVDLSFNPNPCSIYCLCRSVQAASKKPESLPRRPNVGTQLYRKLMLCRLLCDVNRFKHQCCWQQCHYRWAAKQNYPALMFKIDEDDDDLRVQYFSWGRWTPHARSEVTIAPGSNKEHQGGKTGSSTSVVGSCSSGCSVSGSGVTAYPSESGSSEPPKTVDVSATVDDFIGSVSDNDTDSEPDNYCDDVDCRQYHVSGSTASENNSIFSSSHGCESSSSSRSSESSSDSSSSSDSDSDSDPDSDSDSDSCSSSCSCCPDCQSGPGSTHSDSDSEADDPWEDDSERVIDVRHERNPCPKSCSCSRSFEADPPAPIPRQMSTRKPLYESLLRDRLLRRENTDRYACCVYDGQDSWVRRATRRRR